MLRKTLFLTLLLLPCIYPTAIASAEETPDEFPLGKPIDLFDGKTLNGWRIPEEAFFRDHGKISVKDRIIGLGAGNAGTGITCTRRVPRMNYELQLEAKRVKGSDFFCGLTFPYNESYVTLIVGGWGGGATGLSNVDGVSAIENETATFRSYKQNQWYKIRLRVTHDKILAWIDDKEIIDLDTKNRSFSIWWEQEPLRPLGIATWYTQAALRNIRLTRLEELSI